jgi:type II secretion system protein N
MIAPLQFRLVLIYAGAGLLLFLLFLVVMAPPSLIQNRVERWAMEQGVTLRFEGFRSDLPTGFSFQNLAIAPSESREQRYRVSDGALRVDPWALLRGRVDLVLSGIHSEGRFQARLRSAPWFSFNTLDSELTLQDLVLDETAALSGLVRTALLKGTIEGRFRKTDGVGQKGEGSILLREASMLPREHGSAEIMLRNLNADIAYEVNEGIVTLRSSRFKGDGLEGTLSGTIRLAPVLSRSILNLRIEARLDASRVAPRFAAFIPPNRPWRVDMTGELQSPVYTLK